MPSLSLIIQESLFYSLNDTFFYKFSLFIRTSCLSSSLEYINWQWFAGFFACFHVSFCSFPSCLILIGFLEIAALSSDAWPSLAFSSYLKSETLKCLWKVLNVAGLTKRAIAIVNFICQLKLCHGCPNIWSVIILYFLKGVCTWLIFKWVKWVKQTAPPSCGWASLRTNEAHEQKLTIRIRRFLPLTTFKGYTVFFELQNLQPQTEAVLLSLFKMFQPVSQPSESQPQPHPAPLCVQAVDASNSWDFLGSCRDSWLVAIWLPSTTPGRYLGLSHLHGPFAVQFPKSVRIIYRYLFCLLFGFYTLNFFLYYYFSRVLKKSRDEKNMYSSSIEAEFTGL